MRNLVIDFYLTVLFPLMLFVLVLLWNSIRSYLKLRIDREFIWLSGTALFVLCAFMFMPDRWKIFIAYLLWSGLWIVGAASFMVAIPMAWYFGKKKELLRLGICLLVLLMAAASTEHFYHQRVNAWHILRWSR